MSNAAEITEKPSIARVAVPVPLRQLFDFIIPIEFADPAPQIGARVLVPLGARQLIGIVMELKRHSAVDRKRLKPLIEVIDDHSCFDDSLWTTLQWVSRYYCAPIGEVMAMALPVALRKVSSVMPRGVTHWRLTQSGTDHALDDLKRAPKQAAVIQALTQTPLLTSGDLEAALGTSWRAAASALQQKGRIETTKQLLAPIQGLGNPPLEVTLNADQAKAVCELETSLDQGGFNPFLLLGVTGSGKTEVYFRAISRALSLQKQVLVLVPEIGLTPQLVERFSDRFDAPMALLHSGLNDHERHLAWWHARTGTARIVIGTRSAVMAQLPELGLIVVDEEHDPSFKQQEGVRYHARDVAMIRAQQAGACIVLGSATPSLESYRNAVLDRYTLLQLPHRATGTPLPEIALIDLGKEPSVDGISPTLASSLKTAFEQDEQSMLFINRRGYAPALYCTSCRAVSRCRRCEAPLTVHQSSRQLRCHHCGHACALPKACNDCGASAFSEVGEGTQRVESRATEVVPQATVLRIDRDTTRNKGQLEAHLARAKTGDAQVLVGTQLLAKGHDFDRLSLVGVLDTDQALYSGDFRASERVFQRVVQVAGRAGRREQTGRVLIQTQFTDHPLFAFIQSQAFRPFAEQVLQERQSMGLPPFSHLALFRAEATKASHCERFLRTLKQQIPQYDDLRVMDVVTAPMPKRAGRFRYQLLLQGTSRAVLHSALQVAIDCLEKDTDLKQRASRVRWSLDVDPVDLY